MFSFAIPLTLGFADVFLTLDLVWVAVVLCHRWVQAFKRSDPLFFESEYWVHAHLVLYIFLRHHETRQASCLLSRTACKALFNIWRPSCFSVVVRVMMKNGKRKDTQIMAGKEGLCAYERASGRATPHGNELTRVRELIKRKMSCLHKVAGLSESEAEQGLSSFSHIGLLCVFLVSSQRYQTWFGRMRVLLRRWMVRITTSLALLTYFTNLLCISFSPSFVFFFFFFFISHVNSILSNTLRLFTF